MAQAERAKKIDSSFYVEGYATTFEPYLLYESTEGPIYERFDREAFVGCDMDDIIMQYDHEGKVFARNSNGTLIVEPDGVGLFVCADLSKSEQARGMYEEIANGLVTKMSWGFIPKDYHFEPETRTLVHTKVKKIFDVSAVSIPANGGTDIHARKLVDGEINKLMQEVQERKKQLLTLKLKLEE